ncbi:MAG: DUF4124 domain-containing protein [Gammaproteobacteria bacterium]|nr:DUF4124 domain-containing protein [Gammaproteobacteria bacterium]
MKLLQHYIVLVLLLLLSLPAQAELKKWVDQNGQIHYGDKIPPQYLRKEHQIMNKEGVVLKVIPAAKTEEELLEEKRQQRLRIIAAEKKRQQDFKDRVLLDTYTTERDLIKAREERLSTFTSLIDLTGTIIISNKEQLDRLLKRKAEFIKFKKELPLNMQEEEKILRQQIIDNQAYIKDQENERSKLVTQFDEDLKRFNYLQEQSRRREQELERRRLERKQLENKLYGLPPN